MKGKGREVGGKGELKGKGEVKVDGEGRGKEKNDEIKKDKLYDEDIFYKVKNS